MGISHRFVIYIISLCSCSVLGNWDYAFMFDVWVWTPTDLYLLGEWKSKPGFRYENETFICDKKIFPCFLGISIKSYIRKLLSFNLHSIIKCYFQRICYFIYLFLDSHNCIRKIWDLLHKTSSINRKYNKKSLIHWKICDCIFVSRRRCPA